MRNERCAQPRADPAVRDFSCDALGHDLLVQPDHIDDDAAHIDNYRAVALELIDEGAIHV